MGRKRAGTRFSRFREKTMYFPTAKEHAAFVKQKTPEIVAWMRRAGVTCHRDSILRALLYDLWVAEVAKKRLRVFDSESLTSKQLSMS